MLCGPHVNCADLLLQLLVFGLSNGAVLALSAIGVTLIYSTVRILNLAHGDVFALTAVLVTALVNAVGIQQNWPPLLLAGALVGVLAAAILAGMLLSVGVEELAFRPFRGRSRLAPLIATLGLSFMLFQGALVWRTFMHSWIPGEHRSVPGLAEVPTDGIPNLLPGLNLVKALGLPSGVVFRFPDLFVLVMAVGFALATTAFLRRSSLGKALRAVAQNPQLAEMVGVNLNATIRRAFAVGGGLAGAAAFVFALYYSRPFGEHGAESGLLAFAAALIGGIGSPVGALVAALLMGVFSSFSDYFLTAHWTPVLLLALLMLILVVRPTGLAASDTADETATLRDAVILTAPGQHAKLNRWLVWLFAALAIFPLLSLMFNLGGAVLLKGIIVFVLLALGLNLLLGLAGVLDLGYAMSFGIGAYLTAIVTNTYSRIGLQLPQPLDFTPVMLLAALLAGLFGALKGALATRLRGDYLAVATLAFGLLMQRVVINLSDLTGGRSGVGALPPPTIATVTLRDPTAQYYLVFVVVVVIAILSARLIQSRTGRAWLASSEDEGAATASGVDVTRYRMLAFVLSSMLAGAAGALYTSTLAYIDPDVLSFHISTLTLTMVILGGAGSVTGAVLGAMLIVGYDKVIVPGLADLVAQFWPRNAFIGSVPDIRGASYFNFGIALYLTVLLRARQRKPPAAEEPAAAPVIALRPHPPTPSPLAERGRQAQRDGGEASAPAVGRIDAAKLWASLGEGARPPQGIPGRGLRLARLAWAVPVVAAVGLALVALQRAPASTSAAPTSTLASSPYDGQWSGEGHTAGGKPVTLAFTVQGGVVTSISYGYPGLNGSTCTNINYSPIVGIPRPKVDGGKFDAVLGQDAVVGATFSSPGAASGEIRIVWSDRYLNCNGTYQAEWTGGKR